MSSYNDGAIIFPIGLLCQRLFEVFRGFERFYEEEVVLFSGRRYLKSSYFVSVRGKVFGGYPAMLLTQCYREVNKGR